MAPGYAVEERCSWCGEPTESGIYVRTHPTDVPFPAADD